MIRPTPRAVLSFAFSVPLALLVVSLYPRGWYFSVYLPCVVLILLAVDIVTAVPGRRLKAEARFPSLLYIGQSAMVQLHLMELRSAQDTRLPALSVDVLLELSGAADVPVPVRGTLNAGKLDLELKVTPRRRGRVTLEALWLRWRGPLGLSERWRREILNGSIDVVPDIKGVHETALQFFSRDTLYGVKAQQRKGEGAEFENLCDYAPGMDNRFIDWKRSAHHRKLLCKEFRQERNHQIILGFDTGHLMLEPVDGVPKLDHAIKAGLLLGWASLRNGDFLGACAFDVRFRNYLSPGRGIAYFTQFQRFTSDLAYHTEETNFTLALADLRARIQRRALIVLFTEFVDWASAELLLEGLQLTSRRHAVIFVTLRDPMLLSVRSAPPDNFTRAAEAVIADDFLRERQVVLERIARQGVHCLDAPAQAVSTALLNRYLMIKQRGLL